MAPHATVYLLDTTALAAAGVAGAPVTFDAAIDASLAELVGTSARHWSRSPAERARLDG